MQFYFNATKINGIFATSKRSITKIARMKFFKLLPLTILFLFTTKSIAQARVSEIFVGDKSIYITNKMEYPLTGTYYSEGGIAPIVELNENGFGMIQNEDMERKEVLWGIQCSKSGTPMMKKGFDSASFIFWYKENSSEEYAVEDKWIEGHFSIHFRVKKMFVLGTRSKTYVDKEY